MEEVAFQEGHKEMTTFGYLKSREGVVGRRHISKEGTAWAKSRKQERTGVWDEVGMEGGFTPRSGL